jgi:outer membrane protein OmpA-like peptidoglycan-associated protein
LVSNDSLNTVDLSKQLSQIQQQNQHPQESKKASSFSQLNQPDQHPEESQNRTVPSPVQLNQSKDSTSSPEDVFSQLIQSQWHKAQRPEYTSQSVASTSDKVVENSIELFERWQRLLLTQEVMDSRQALANFKQKLEKLEHQVYEPQELINLLVPLITKILSIKIAQSREDIAHAIAPIVDEMIQHRSQQDKEAMSSALAPVLPVAVAKEVSNSPGALARALGPEIGPAIKEQISVERDAMVDALYPVIGSTISKYMAEAIRSINEKVENAFSLEGMSRKIRAKMQGVSEAELIFKEAMPFTVQAVFLIHKGSGLVISEVQPSDQQHLESEMVAGMLTAIRSFVNDCIAQSGNVSEIDQIEYGNSKIILEVAGYCYLAAVTQGEPPKSFMRKMRDALVTIVQRHGKSVELFDGDPANVPEQIHPILQALTKANQSPTAAQKGKPPIALMLIGLTVLSAIFIPTGIHHHLSAIDRQREEETSLALASDPELAVYRIGVDASLGTLKLTGKLPNQYLRAKAEQIAKKVEPKLKIQNAIVPVEVPPDLVAAQAEVKRLTNLLNQVEGTVIWADYNEGKVIVQGAVLQEADIKKITEAFGQIPGVKSVISTVQLQPLAIASRVYFDQGSSELKSEERSKIAQIGAFLEQYPSKHLKLLGHTDPKGTATENQELAVARATKVRGVLVAQGVDPKRLQVEGTTNPPIGVKAEQIPVLSRCVEFELITP